MEQLIQYHKKLLVKFMKKPFLKKIINKIVMINEKLNDRFDKFNILNGT